VFTKRPLAAVAEGVGVNVVVGRAVGEALALGLAATSLGLAIRGIRTTAAIMSAAAAATSIAPRLMRAIVVRSERV
jgi:hypothetical protein